MPTNPILIYQPTGGVPTGLSGPVLTSQSSGGGTPILGYQPGGGVPIGSGSVAQRQGYIYYWPDIENLTGGIISSDLDAQDISVLMPDALIIVCIPDRGESHWLRVEDSGSPVTDTDAGVITPTNYDSILRPFVLHRQLGF